jgi:hypothetical protein
MPNERALEAQAQENWCGGHTVQVGAVDTQDQIVHTKQAAPLRCKIRNNVADYAVASQIRVQLQPHPNL